ncbi:hypothetical protein [Streptomyces sp. P5_D11]
MTPLDRTATASFKSQRSLAWATIAVGLTSIAAVVFLGLTGHTAAATAAGAIGGAVFTASGISVTVNIRR